MNSQNDSLLQLTRSGMANDLEIPLSLPSLLTSHIDALMSKFNDIESRLSNSTIDNFVLQQETTDALLKMSYACKEYEDSFAHSPEVIVRARSAFRAITDRYFSKSYFMKRARTWPQGYPGDYQTLESVYRNTPLSTGLGYFMDVHFLRSTLGNAVRERIVTLTDILSSSLKQYVRPSILNIACGSCRELPGLSQNIMDVGGHIICIDHDEAALDFSMRRLVSTPLDPQHTFFKKYNAVKMINYDRNMKEFGPQDIIYSAGFFDYLNDDTLIRLLNSAYRMLKPGGTLIAPFKDANKYRTQEYHWFVDWTGFLQRKPEDVLALLEKAGIPRSLYEVSRDRTGVILFIVARA
jgi:extracellular factor (EF) 3-hydroxypalmitic acid methyl ester biosynthesis protein